MKHVSFDFYPRNASPFPFLKSKKKKVFIAKEETRKLTSSTTSTNKPSFLFFKNGNLRVTNVFNFVKFFLSLWYRGFSLVVQVHHGFILFLPSYHPPNIRFTMVDHVKRWIVFSILRSALMLCMQFFLSEKKTKMKNIKKENKKKMRKNATNCYNVPMKQKNISWKNFKFSSFFFCLAFRCLRNSKSVHWYSQLTNWGRECNSEWVVEI